MSRERLIDRLQFVYCEMSQNHVLVTLSHPSVSISFFKVVIHREAVHEMAACDRGHV